MARIIIIDPDKSFGLKARQVLSGEGHDVTAMRHLTEALLGPEINKADAVFLDISEISEDPSTVLSWILDQEEEPEIVILASELDKDKSQEFINAGAWDVLPKPRDLNKLKSVLTHLLKYRSGKTSGEEFMEDVLNISPGLISGNTRFMECLRLSARAARSDVNVLIRGETGVGKELVAQVIHGLSARKSRNFVLLDCAALPDTLVESIMFGHLRGSFTGADRTQEGLIAQADGGSLFLDEVGELPLNVQKSFLRVLDEQSFRPVGGKNLQKSDFRVIAATNRDLEQMVVEKRFREDLLHRLKVMSIYVPPLRDRKLDISLQADYQKKVICRRHNIPEIEMSPEFVDILTRYPWPGNVRELIHSLERAVVAARGSSVLYPVHLPSHIRAHQGDQGWDLDSEKVREAVVFREDRTSVVPGRGTDQEGFELLSMKDEREKVLGEMEKSYLWRLMRTTGWNVSRAVDISGLSRSRLYALMNQYGIKRPK